MKYRKSFEQTFRLRRAADRQYRWFLIRSVPVKDRRGRIVRWYGMATDVHDRKLAEENLQKNEELFRRVFEEGPIGIAMVAMDGLILRANNRLCRMLGYSEPALIKAGLVGISHPEDMEKDRELAKRLRQGQIASYSMDKRYVRKNGSFLLARLSVSALRDKRGVPVNLIGMIEDISDRKRAEDALRASAARYRLMVEAVPMMAWRCDASGGLVEANRRWYAYTGQTLARARGTGWMKALHADDARRVANVVQDDVRGGVIYETEYRLRRASDGRYRWHLARALPVRDADGTVVAWFGAAADIEDQKNVARELERRIEERTAALRESEERLRLTIEAGGMGTWDWNLRTGRIAWDDRQRELFGISRDTPVSQQAILGRWIHPEDIPEVKRLFDDAIRNCSDVEQEFRVALSDGSIRWLSVRARVFCDRRGRPERMIGVNQDITARKTAEANRLRLEHEVMEAAEREQQRIGRDLHDGLSQVLTGLSFKAHILHDRLVEAKSPCAREAAHIEEYLRMAVTQGRELAASLHPVSALPDGLSVGLFRFSQMVEELFHVRCRFLCPVPVLVHDVKTATHLYRIAQEAVHNAVKHGRARKIGIRLRPTPDGLELSIRDNGCGFTAQTQGDGGIGLRTMRYRAGAIGGALSIRSRPSRGTTVTCRAPLPSSFRDSPPGAQ